MEEELLSGPVAPQATSEKMLQILSGLAPRDPAAANPATTAAMARSRDAITRTLQRQMERQEEPFSGINDVATAAITALTSRHKTPFGSALAKLDADRDNSTIRTASALGQQAQRESKTGIDPIRAANLVMRHIEQGVKNNDRDAREIDSFVKTLSSNMEPASALRFQTSYGKAIADYVQQTGRNPEPSEVKTLISDFAQRGGFQTKPQSGNVMMYSPFGELIHGNRNSGTATVVTPGAAGAGGTPVLNSPDTAPRYPTGEAPLTQGEARVPPGPPAMPPPRGAPGAAPQGNDPPPGLTAGATAAWRSKTGERNRSAEVFKKQADHILRIIDTAGPTATGITGSLAATIGGALEQIGGSGTFNPDEVGIIAAAGRQLAGTGWAEAIVGKGGQAARVRAGLISLAAAYAKATDPGGRVTKDDLDKVLMQIGGTFTGPRQMRAVIEGWVNDIRIHSGVETGPEQALGGGLPKATRYGPIDQDPRALKIREALRSGAIDYDQARKLIEALD